MPCPRCGGEGKGILRDCRLCDDLCYITEPWVQCGVCFGRGKSGHLGDLSPDCYACRGVGYTKPGYGVGVPGYGAMASPAPGMAPIPPMAPMAPAYGGPMYPPVQPPMYGADLYGPGYVPPF